ncbi:MAG: glycosyltransferase [Candidatus Accumulibacter sp.]|jgi:glycosyltransferase involved in cell wall biosynthesis|nr:glycosyltransferase [Accumulibacter sp.]
MLKITVVTVSFNAVRTIGRTLDSVAAQDYPAIEHIVVDGASTDGTLGVVESREKNLARFVSEPDRGIYDAMNKGLDLATGDIVCFLNADDFYATPQVLGRVADKLESLGVDALIGDLAYFSPDAPDRVVRRFNSGRFSPERLAYGWMPAHAAFFMKREIYERVGRFKIDYRIAGDFEFIARAFSKESIRYCYFPEILVKMQLGGISNAGLGARLLSNREILRACRENGLETGVWKLSLRYPIKLLELLKR